MARTTDCATRETKDAAMTISMTPELREEIRQIAKANERSDAAMARILLREAIDARNAAAK